MEVIEGRFVCYWWSAIRSDVAWTERIEDCRKACAMSEAEVKWAREKAAAIHQELIEDEQRRKDGHACMTKDEHTTREAERSRISDACITWEIGEEIRKRRIWIEECEEWARRTNET